MHVRNKINVIEKKKKEIKGLYRHVGGIPAKTEPPVLKLNLTYLCKWLFLNYECAATYLACIYNQCTKTESHTHLN